MSFPRKCPPLSIPLPPAQLDFFSSFSLLFSYPMILLLLLLFILQSFFVCLVLILLELLVCMVVAFVRILIMTITEQRSELFTLFLAVDVFLRSNLLLEAAENKSTARKLG